VDERYAARIKRHVERPKTSHGLHVVTEKKEEDQQRIHAAMACQPLRHKMLAEKARKLALEHIMNANNDKDILTKEQVLGMDRPILTKMFDLHKTQAYRGLIVGVYCTYIIMAFYEPITAQELADEGLSPILTFLTVFFLSVLTTHSVSKSWVWSSSQYTARSDILNDHTVTMKQTMLKIVLLMLWADLVMVLGWRTSMQYMLPVRATLVLILNKGIFKASYCFFKTFYLARSVFLLYLTIFLVFSLASLTLLTDVNAGQFESSFETIVRTLATTFVYMSSGNQIYRQPSHFYSLFLSFFFSFVSSILSSILTISWYYLLLTIVSLSTDDHR